MPCALQLLARWRDLIWQAIGWQRIRTPWQATRGRIALVGMGVAVLAALMLGLGAVLTASTALAQGSPAQVSEAVKHDTSPALRSLPAQPAAPGPRPARRVTPLARDAALAPLRADPVRQAPVADARMPAPRVSFNGIAGTSGATPPDIVGAVGPSHYVQMTNDGFAIYNKAGAQLFGPATTSTLFTGFGGPCETDNDGDPIVLYDRLADRWLLSQFAAVNTGPPFFECVAISQTPDPLGAYYRYAFQFTQFPDYPKFGVWPDAYYLSLNIGNFGDVVGAVALERDRMLQGQPARMVFRTITSPPGVQGFPIPSHVTSAGPPPVGTPNFFVRAAAAIPSLNRLDIFEYHVDWTNPASSTISGPTSLTTAPYDADLCALGGNLNCLAQPNTPQRVDGLGAIMMQPLPYRNFGTHEAIVGNFAVDVGDFQDHAGIRWFELRRSGGGAWRLQQESTWAPDAAHRWNGSIGQDRDGNIALGYSVSSSTVFPAIRYAGRLAGDPLGTLAQGETSLIEGGGSQTRSNRWGDYSAMVVDPTDDCTFWYTNEYYPTTSPNRWSTRIGSFRFPSCGVPPTPTPTLTPSPTPTQVPPPTPPVSGTPGIPCTTLIGSACRFSGQATGTWTKTGSGTFTATGNLPANALVGGTPTIFLPTTSNANGEAFPCQAVTAALSTVCTGTTAGNLLLGARVTIAFPLVGGGSGSVTGVVSAGGVGQGLTTAQAVAQAQAAPGFAASGAGVPCAVQPGQPCAVAGALAGSVLRTGSFTFSLTATAQAAGTPPVAVFHTDQSGVVGALCGAAPTAAGTAFTCSGTFAGAGMPVAGSAACVVFSLAPGAVVCGTVSAPGPAVAPPPPPPPLLPPLPLLPPPLALVPPPPPFAALASAPAGDARAAAAFTEVPVIPEAHSVGLVLVGLLVVTALGARRARRRSAR